MKHMKKVRMEDIAKELDVSIVTVSNALKGKNGVGENLRLEILKKAEDMGYQIKKNFQPTYQIGVIIAERYVKEYASFYMAIYKHLVQASRRQGYQTALAIIEAETEQEKRILPLFGSVNIEGLLIIGEMQIDYIRKLHSEIKIPVVCVDFYNMDMDMDYIVTDNLHGMQQITQKLIDAGHRDIGFVGAPCSTNSVMDRYMGYCKALQMNGIPERKDRLYYDREDDGNGQIYNIELTEDLPTAFVCNCDRTAIQLIEELAKRGIRVPEDVSVGGFDSYCNKKLFNVDLLTYESDLKALAQISMKILIKRIERKREPEGIRIVEGKVVEGNTVKRLYGD